MVKKNISTKRYLLVMMVLPTILLISFIFGIHWHGTLGHLTYLQKLTHKKLTCYGHNNLSETYQQDCYAPYTDKPFVWTNRLNCSYTTHHSLDVDNISQQLSATNIKRDYESFQLKIDTDNKTLMRSSSPGDVVQGDHTIINEDENTILAQRKFVLPEPFNGTNYEYIFLSKKSGIGTISHTDIASHKNNSSFIGTNFFYCN